MTASSRLITDTTFRMRDGRTLGYVEAGKRGGVPIFHFHGNGASRLEVLTVVAPAERLGMRLIGLDRPGIGRSLGGETAFAHAAAESYRQGADASTKDGLIFARPWDFLVEAITFEHLFLWHGAQDQVMPVAAARLLAAALPHCTATFYPEEGHLSTFVNHVSDIWTVLSS